MARPEPAQVGTRPPSVDALARSLASSGLPHVICVDVARQAIAQGQAAGCHELAHHLANRFTRSLLMPVINATGVLLHTNLGRAPVAVTQAAHAQNLEFDLATGERGSRHAAVGQLMARLCGAQAAMVVNNNAAAVLLVTAALATGREVLVSRGESVEIGGSFRVPEVIEQSGARLVDVGTTNRTRLADYRKAMGRARADVAMVLKVHPSNYRVEGFVEGATVAQLAQLGTVVVADLGSGLIDATCPWLPGPPPAWLAEEPAARQTIEAGADLVTFSGDKLFGGPQAGIIAGRADLIEACLRHPLARALRPGGMVLSSLQSTALAYLHRTVVTDIAFWNMVATPVEALRARADRVAGLITSIGAPVAVTSVAMQSLPGAGAAPGTTIASHGLALAGDRVAWLRDATPPIIARARDGATNLDLRSVDPADDEAIVQALTRAS